MLELPLLMSTTSVGPSPVQPQDAYGLEKLATEELCKHYTKDFGMQCRIGRFHNIYGPYGTWKGEAQILSNFTSCAMNALAFESTRSGAECSNQSG